MPRPPNAQKGIDLHVVLPPDVGNWLEVYLYSEAQHRIPVGAKAAFITRLIRDFKENLTRVQP